MKNVNNANKEKNKISGSSQLRVTVALALLAAISIVCGKYLAIRAGDVMRFSLENMPIIFASVAFGPWLGALVAAVADILGCVLVGYEINPVVTLGAVALAITAGLAYRAVVRTRVKKSVAIVIATVVGHVVGSVVIKTVGLSAYYSYPFVILMLWRLLNYVIVGALDATVLVILFRNHALQRSLDRIKNGGCAK